MIADPNQSMMPCIFCEKECEVNQYPHNKNADIEKTGYDRAIVVHTYGNYGSQIVDGGLLSFVICDECFVKHSSKMLARDEKRINGTLTQIQVNARDYFIDWFNQILKHADEKNSYVKKIAPYFFNNAQLLNLNCEKYLTHHLKIIRQYARKQLNLPNGDENALL